MYIVSAMVCVLHLYAFSIDSIVSETRLLFYLAQPVHVHESGEV